MSEVDAQKKKVVVLGASVACMGAAAAALHGHPMLVGAVVVLQLVALVFAVVEFVKLKRQG